MTIEIHDEELIAQLQQIAQLENRSIEDVLKAMVRYYMEQVLIKDELISDDDIK